MSSPSPDSVAAGLEAGVVLEAEAGLEAEGARWSLAQVVQLLAEAAVEEEHWTRAKEARAEARAERWMTAEAVASGLRSQAMVEGQAAQKR